MVNTKNEDFIKKYAGVTEEYTFYNGTEKLRYDKKKHIYYKVTDTDLIKLDGVTTVVKIIDKSSVLVPWGCKMMELKFLNLLEKENTNEFQKEWLQKVIKEAKSAHKDKLEEAGTVGHETHSWIEDFIKASMTGDPIAINNVIVKAPASAKAQSAVTAALDWINRHNVRWLLTERKIFSRSCGYAGTMDGLCLADSCDDKSCCPEVFKDRKTLIDWKTSNYLYVDYILQTNAYRYAYEEETGEKIEDIWIIRLGKTDSKFEAWHLPKELHEAGWLAFSSALSLSRSMKYLETSMKEYKTAKKA